MPLQCVSDVRRIPPALSVFFFFTLVTGPTRSLSLKLSDTRVYEPQIRARLGFIPPAPSPRKALRGGITGVPRS